VSEEREVLSLEPIASDPEVGRWLSAMDWCRRETLEALEGVTDESVDWRPEGESNTIGTVLYHVALVEADWLVVDIFEGTMPLPQEILPWGDRDAEGILTSVQGTPLKEHLERLEAIRALFVANLRTMPSEDFHRLRHGERFDVSPAWVVYHLLQHEAEHREQIARLRDAHPGS
jgi:uncharacterized damage-inducible protein DinB